MTKGTGQVDRAHTRTLAIRRAAYFAISGENVFPLPSNTIR